MLLSTTLLTALALGATANAASHRVQPGSHRASRALAPRGVSFGAPHYSLYVYDEITSSNWPTADSVAPYNRVLLAFWTTSGATTASKVWEGLSASQRQSILDSYHNAGIAVMVSAFGYGDNVITDKKDPVQVAQSLASWAKTNGVDGVDIDFEDFKPLQDNPDFALDWLTKFHKELRNQLPSQAISSTPTAWIYGDQYGSANSVFCRLQGTAGDTISWYNMQFYNGFPGTWDTCPNTMWHSDNNGFLSLAQISQQCNIPMDKITVGKLWNKNELAHANTEAQIPTPKDFGTCLAQAKAQVNYPETGVMVWYGEMNNWSAAINFLKDTLSAMNSANANPPAVSSAAAASSNADAASTSATAASAAPAVSNGSVAVAITSEGNTTSPNVSVDSSSAASAVSGASTAPDATGTTAGSTAGNSANTASGTANGNKPASPSGTTGGSTTGTPKDASASGTAEGAKAGSGSGARGLAASAAGVFAAALAATLFV